MEHEGATDAENLCSFGAYDLHDRLRESRFDCFEGTREAGHVKQFKIGNSWIRGVVGEGLTCEIATDFACAYGTYSGGREVVLARDTRRSSPMLAAAALSGLVSTGCSVANAGVCPTPVAQYLVRSRGAGGAIVVTGSHNAAGWNALKFIDEDGALLNAIRGEDVLDLYHLGEYTKATICPFDTYSPVVLISNFSILPDI